MRPGLRAVSALSIMACCGFYFLEWLFFVTKPSMFSAMSASASFRVLMISPLSLIAVCLILIAAFGLLGKLFGQSRYSSILGSVTMLIPALVIAAAAYLLIDNFTYTVFGFNTGSFHGFTRYFYILLFLTFLSLAYKFVSRTLGSSLWLVRQKTIAFIILAPLTVSIFTALYQFERAQSGSPDYQETAARGMPNILILSTDGLIADRMSAYGYHRNTTPFIDSLLEDALIFENVFTNSVPTTGSIGSLLSGRLPATTRVVMRPDTFAGNDSFLHLPGLLRNMGYITADISIRYYADAYDLNMKQAFDYANGRRISERIYSRLPLSIQSSYNAELRFLEESSERLQARFLHAAGFEDMINPYEKVTELNDQLTNEDWSDDSDRVKQLIEFIEESVQPFFAHVHFLGTHGTYFFPRQRIFSAGQKQMRSEDPFLVQMPMVERSQLRRLDWMDDFYDDAILDYDRSVREVIGYLEANRQLEETIVVLISDHGAARASHERIPLIIRFPGALNSGRYAQNVQLIDIAPTILDFLDAPVPGWMDGEILLRGVIDPLRPIFSVGVNSRNGSWVDGWWGTKEPKAPFYSMGSLSIVQCHTWYFLSLEDGVMTSQEVEGHTSPCSEDNLLTIPQARQLMVDHLVHNDYEAEFLLEGKYRPSPFAKGNDIGSIEKVIPCNDPSRGSKIDQGMCFLNKSKLQLGLNMFQSALNNDPGNALAANNICATYNNLGEFKKGIQACRKALKIRPDFDLAKNNLAWAETKLEEARLRARKQEMMAGRNRDANAFLSAGHAYYRIGDYTESLYSWQQALKLEPGNSIHSNNVAIAMIALERHEQAILMLDTALAIDPDKALYQNNMKWARSLLEGEAQ